MDFNFPTINVKIIDELNELYEQINNSNIKSDQLKKNIDKKFVEISEDILKINKKTDIIHELFNRYRQESCDNLKNVQKNIFNSPQFNQIREYIENILYLDNTNSKKDLVKIDTEILNSLIKLKHDYAQVVDENKQIKHKIEYIESKLKNIENLLETTT